MEEDGSASGMVLVPVPQEHLSAVYALLGNLMNGQPTASPDAGDEQPCPHCRSSAYLASSGGAYRCGECGLVFQQPRGVEVDHENGCWTQQMVERLHTHLGSITAARALDVIAARAPATVTYNELLTELAVEPNHLRAELAVLSKTSRQLFGRKIWPMSARQGWGEGARMGYRMPERIANWWLAASQARARHTEPGRPAVAR